MVYDNTLQPRSRRDLTVGGAPGFTIHETPAYRTWEGEEVPAEFDVYTDDGRGNGDFVCSTPVLAWARAIAQSLDYVATVGEQVRR